MILLLAAMALAAASCGGDDDEGGGDGEGGEVTAVASSSCAKLEYEGEGDPDFIVVSDLPRQGGSRLQTTQMVGAMRLLLQDKEWKAGDYNVAYQDCDDSTA